jgi:hypothetical protein
VLLLAGCGYISQAERDARWDLDGDGVERPNDCDDQDPAVSPREPERCEASGRDEDCDGFADELDPDCAPTVPTVPTDPDCGEPPVARLLLGEGVAEVGALPLVADGSASTGQALSYRVDWGDGSAPEADPLPVLEHLYPMGGWFLVGLEVEDSCGRTARAEGWAAVAEPGQLLRVSAALSLHEALTLAASRPGPQLVTFEPGLGPVSVDPDLPALVDAQEMLIGWGVTLDGSAGGWLEVQGEGGIVAGLELAGFTDDRYGALRLQGEGSLARGLTVRDSAVGVVLEGEGSSLWDSTVRHSQQSQVVVKAKAHLQGLRIEDGEGAGVSLEGQADGSELRLCQVLGSATSGVELANDVDSVSILDSTVVRSGGDGITAGKRVGDFALRNVILAFNGGQGLGGDLEFAQGSPSHDVWFDNGLGDCQACTTLGLGSLTEDPMLADVQTGDLAPLPDSPVIDAGTLETQTDKNGPSEGHHDGEAPEIGAVEVP